MKKNLAACCIALLAVACELKAADKIRVLVLTGNSDWSHPWEGTAPFMQGVLIDSGRFDVKLEEEVRGITAATLANYDVLLDYYYGPRWGATTERAVEEFVRSGKGMIAVHGVTYGPFFGQAGGSATEPRRMEGEPWPAFADMLGMSWKLENIGHAKRHIFAVKWVDTDHPISRGLPPTFVANDELYHKIDLRPNANVLATAYDDPRIPGGTGNTEPVIWTVPYGQGRVVMMVLGHDLLAMSQPGFMDALTRGAEWSATGNVLPKATSMASATSVPAPAHKQ
ncbi:MAG: ThuA domain-containing protein [Acidobacteriota bacterium]|nr:ThuA domain-containing protein [Acidobacteriota bacterium]